MTVHEELPLAADFPQATRDQWREMAAAVLRKMGRDEESLVTTTYDKIEIEPLYDRVSGGRPPYIRPGPWEVRQRHDHDDPAAGNRAILDDLKNGVNSLWLGETAADDLPVLLSGVDLGGISIAADGGDAALLNLLSPGLVRGNLGTEDAGLARRCAAEFPGVRAMMVDALPYHDAGAAEAQELGCSIADGVARLRALTDAGLSVDEALGQLAFRYAATADQFLTIAKLRAARILWARVAEASGADEGYQVQHAVTSSAMMTRYDPETNMLRATLACFGAGAGGADAVTVQPFDDTGRRLARNTQSLLLEESGLARVADPAGGSGYVESLTGSLAEAAWAWFQEIERAGRGARGLIAARIEEVRRARLRNIATRRDPITGVSEYPAPGAPRAKGTPRPRPENVPDNTAGLPPIRYAEPYEELRDRVQGSGARVYLAPLGPLAAYTARERFAANLFQAGGFEIVTGPPEEFSGEVACICSTDAIYSERAAEAAALLRAAGARLIWLAGTAQTPYEGVDGYIFTGCDAIDVLETTLGVFR